MIKFSACAAAVRRTAGSANVQAEILPFGIAAGGSDIAG